MTHAATIKPSSPDPLTARADASALFHELGALSMRELETVFQRGHLPHIDDLAGWQFRGMNTPKWAKLAGIKKFIKGFYRADSGIVGYNSPALQNNIHSAWTAKPSDESPKRFGFYSVAPVDARARDNKYLHAILLDYGSGGNNRFDPTSGLRDYVVQVDANNSNLLLGKAYYAIGPLRVATSFFVLERYRPGISDASEL